MNNLILPNSTYLPSDSANVVIDFETKKLSPENEAIAKELAGILTEFFCMLCAKHGVQTSKAVLSHD